jgi:hypothetical protein
MERFHAICNEDFAEVFDTDADEKTSIHSIRRREDEGFLHFKNRVGDLMGVLNDTLDQKPKEGEMNSKQNQTRFSTELGGGGYYVYDNEIEATVCEFDRSYTGKMDAAGRAEKYAEMLNESTRQEPLRPKSMNLEWIERCTTKTLLVLLSSAGEGHVHIGPDGSGYASGPTSPWKSGYGVFKAEHVANELARRIDEARLGAH